MCGIFGMCVRGDSAIQQSMVSEIIDALFILSESRGKEAAGVAFISADRVEIYKDAVQASQLIRDATYRTLLGRITGGFFCGETQTPSRCALAILGHSRLVTDGMPDMRNNNQPVVAQGTIGIHNGIIVNAAELCAQFPSLKREHEVDTEVLLRLIHMYRRQGRSVPRAVGESFGLIEGAASVAIGFDDADAVVLATNTGSLYMCGDRAGTAIVFASERYILSRLVRQRCAKRFFDESDIAQLKPGLGCYVSLASLSQEQFSLRHPPRQESVAAPTRTTAPRTIREHVPEHMQREAPRVMPGRADPAAVRESEALSRADEEAIACLKRCTRCILPETMPFIEFDEEGVCNYCRGYKKVQVRGHEALMKAVEPYRRTNGEPDCIVSVSGGRDSTYGLHYVKNVLELNPIAYTYDWGMVTDLARRNISRICGKLGIEHILISADIARKRSNIRKNVEAWLKKPDLGMVPLFMAGDKHYFYYMHKLQRETGIKLTIYSDNPLEKTEFKSGFCGVRESKGESYYALPGINKFRLALYYGRQFLSNHFYLNASLLDSLSAFYATYGLRHDYLMIYSYTQWDEEIVLSLIRSEYNWELASDTKSTWRIGDGTAPFYNYIYYTVAGFTENDTFRSNQIREGMIGREKALALVREENQLRYESIRWYCTTIGVDFDEVMRKINSIPALYR